MDFKDVVKSEGNKFSFSREGYTSFSMPISIYFHKNTGLRVKNFKLPKFDYSGVINKPFVKMNKKKFSAIIN